MQYVKYINPLYKHITLSRNSTDVFREYTRTDGHSDLNKTLRKFKDAPMKT